MNLTIIPSTINSETRYPFRTPNPADTVDLIISSLGDIEKQIDSPEVDSEIVELSTGGMLFSRNSRPALNIRLRDTKVQYLKKFGCAILPVCFGNLVYLVKYEYIDDVWTSKQEAINKAKSKLNTLDKWMEYTFIQTLGDYVYVELIKKYDPDFTNNLQYFKTFFTVE
ncbi:MAG: hypothetical protein LBQ68_10645 [Clostridiales bacterium]|jgi:hypothetical protein|nr:hypothetical protein [Clostridiales bacterium]